MPHHPACGSRPGDSKWWGVKTWTHPSERTPSSSSLHLPGERTTSGERQTSHPSTAAPLGVKLPHPKSMRRPWPRSLKIRRRLRKSDRGRPSRPNLPCRFDRLCQPSPTRSESHLPDAAFERCQDWVSATAPRVISPSLDRERQTNPKTAYGMATSLALSQSFPEGSMVDSSGLIFVKLGAPFSPVAIIFQGNPGF